MPKTIQKKSTATKDKSNPNQSNHVTGIDLKSSPAERRVLAESNLNTPTKAKSFFDPKDPSYSYSSEYSKSDATVQTKIIPHVKHNNSGSRRDQVRNSLSDEEEVRLLNDQTQLIFKGSNLAESVGLPKKTFEMIGGVAVKSEPEKKLKLTSDSVPKRTFIKLPENAEEENPCLGTVWFECPSGHFPSSFCTHCLDTLIQIKTMVCDLWDGLNEDFLQELLVKQSQLIESIQWRDDLKSAILAVKTWNPLCGMTFVPESNDDVQRQTDENSNTCGDTLMTEAAFYDAPRDTCPLCNQDVYNVKVWDGKRVCTSCRRVYKKLSKSALNSYLPSNTAEKFTPLPNLLELQSIPGPRLFVCTLTRNSGRRPPPQDAHQYVWDMLERKNGLPGRWNGSSVVTGNQHGAALPGQGSVVWALKAHFQNAVYGGILRAQTSRGYVKCSMIESYAKQLMTHEDDCFMIACSTPENFLCTPHHIIDFLIRFDEVRKLGTAISKSQLQQPRAIPLEKLFFAFQGLVVVSGGRNVVDRSSMYKMTKCFTVFSGQELKLAIQNRIALNNLLPVVRFLSACRKLASDRELGLHGQGRNIEQLEDSQPTASQELLDWTVDERDFVPLD